MSKFVQVFLMEDEEIQREIEAMKSRGTSTHTPEERKRYDRLWNEKEERMRDGRWSLGAKRDPRRARRDEVHVPRGSSHARDFAAFSSEVKALLFARGFGQYPIEQIMLPNCEIITRAWRQNKAPCSVADFFADKLRGRARRSPERRKSSQTKSAEEILRTLKDQGVYSGSLERKPHFLWSEDARKVEKLFQDLVEGSRNDREFVRRVARILKERERGGPPERKRSQRDPKLTTKTRERAKKLEVFALIHGWSYLSDEDQELVRALRAEREAAKRRREARRRVR